MSVHDYTVIIMRTSTKMAHCPELWYKLLAIRQMARIVLGLTALKCRWNNNDYSCNL